MRLFEYQDTVTFVKVTSSEYGNDKVASSYDDVRCVFLQDTAFVHGGYRDNVDSDAVCYPDPESTFVKNNYSRLEGMYILASLFGSGASDSWYKVENVIVNRDHLLSNQIDNIELRLKKTRPIAGVS